MGFSCRALAFGLALVLFLVPGCVGEQAGESKEFIDGGSLRLLSSDFEGGQPIPREFTCDGSGVNPELRWEGVPSNAKSLALVVFDPDAPAGTFYHWLVCNIPKGASSIARGGALPGAIELENDFGETGYGGPCPPSGTHRYFFRLYALGVEKIECGSRQQFLQLIAGHKVAEAELMGTYARG